MKHKLIAQPKGKKSIKAPLTTEDIAALQQDKDELKKKKKKYGILGFLTGDN